MSLHFVYSVAAGCAALLLGTIYGTAAPGTGVTRMSQPEAPASEQTAQTPSIPAEGYFVYIGTYTGGQSKGIYLCRMDAGGRLSPAELVAETPNPSFVAASPDGRFLYAVNEIAMFEGKQTGAVAAYAIDPATGHLIALNRKPSMGTGPCYVSLDRTGRTVFVANYGSGSVAALPVADDGSLGNATVSVQHHGFSVDRARQEGPHAHSILLDPSNRHAYSCDLGLDKVLIYRFDAATHRLDPNAVPDAMIAPGSGPRHIAFHPNGQFAYVINEMGNTITAFRHDAATGALETLETVSTLPADFSGSSTGAELQLSPDGRFLYGSNRGHDSIVAYAVDQKTGHLTYAGIQPTQGKTPRSFSLDPSGRYVVAANQDSDTLVVFHRDPQTGKLTPAGQSLTAPKPVCVEFVRAGR